ncbi:hypothetical protein IG631_03265 [Alternaria alternata]|nr:hypothetical protein IG631_03265 [Alternaria alternata]
MRSGCPTIDSLSQAQKPYVLFYNFPVVLHNAMGLKSGKIAVDSALLRVEGFAGGSFWGAVRQLCCRRGVRPPPRPLALSSARRCSRRSESGGKVDATCMTMSRRTSAPMRSRDVQGAGLLRRRSW